MVPFEVKDKRTGDYADIETIVSTEEWAKGLMYCDMEGFAITQDGYLILLDECGKYEYCPADRFEVINNNDYNQWVLCSERLPEGIGTYMTTLDYEEHGLAVGQRYYHGTGLGWEDDCVIAWMPLPEPYTTNMRGEEE